MRKVCTLSTRKFAVCCQLFYCVGKVQSGLLGIVADMLMCSSNYAAYFGLEWITQMEVITAELSKSDWEAAVDGNGGWGLI